MAIRPLILAGGLGTRMRPRTLVLPKPLLPIDGRPLLWYAVRSVTRQDLLPPIVTTAYKADLIEEYFATDGVVFRRLENIGMAESVLQIAETDPEASSFLGMSSDVLIRPDAVDAALDAHATSGLDTVLFVRLTQPGHKKWEFELRGDFLADIHVRPTNTPHERLLLVLRRDSLLRLRHALPIPVVEETLPAHLTGFQSGWVLLLKTLLSLQIPIRAALVDAPVWNVNVNEDLEHAAQFVRTHRIG